MSSILALNNQDRVAHKTYVSPQNPCHNGPYVKCSTKLVDQKPDPGSRKNQLTKCAAWCTLKSDDPESYQNLRVRKVANKTATKDSNPDLGSIGYANSGALWKP